MEMRASLFANDWQFKRACIDITHKNTKLHTHIITHIHTRHAHRTNTKFSIKTMITARIPDCKKKNRLSSVSLDQNIFFLLLRYASTNVNALKSLCTNEHPIYRSLCRELVAADIRYKCTQHTNRILSIENCTTEKTISIKKRKRIILDSKPSNDDNVDRESNCVWSKASVYSEIWQSNFSYCDRR